jgi:Flp pilus assembly protein TadG
MHPTQHRNRDVLSQRMKSLRRIPSLPKRERGAFGILTALLIMVIFGFCGMAIDLAMAYNRKTELQTIVDSIALAAASQLNGTDTGIANALSAAQRAAGNYGYGYNNFPVQWSNNAISFASSPYASTWTDASSATGKAGELFFVKVDTAQLDDSHGRVSLVFMQLFAPTKTSVQIANRAVAGRSSANILPLAICAMSLTEGAKRDTELVEYGFRRGIDYDLMRLNPNGTTQGANYLVNPFAPADTTGSSVMSRLNVIRPFLCTGTLAIPPFKLATPSTSGSKITVEPGFPLASVFASLNSRFGTYSGACDATNSPPDTNIKPYPYLTALTWMNNVPSGQSAEPRTTSKALMTLPDLAAEDIPGTTTPNMYGPLWLFAKPALFSEYKPGNPEPAGGYQTFSPTAWSTLYPKGTPKLKSGSNYPTPTPYGSTTQSQAPPAGTKGLANRRVLNIPLLRCPVPVGAPVGAEVLAIGKFFMTVPATDNALYAEFAGLAQPSSLIGQVELYP